MVTQYQLGIHRSGKLSIIATKAGGYIRPVLLTLLYVFDCRPSVQPGAAILDGSDLTFFAGVNFSGTDAEPSLSLFSQHRLHSHGNAHGILPGGRDELEFIAYGCPRWAYRRHDGFDLLKRLGDYPLGCGPI